jgi:hypothetical protein
MKIRSLILASAMLTGLLVLSGCADFQFDWKQSVHDSLVNMCDTQTNCSH